MSSNPVLVAPAAAAAPDPRKKSIEPLARSIREILHHFGPNLKTKATTTCMRGTTQDPRLFAVETKSPEIATGCKSEIGLYWLGARGATLR